MCVGRRAPKGSPAELRTRVGPVHDNFQTVDGLLVLAAAHVGVADVAEDAVADLLARVGDLVQGHTVHADGHAVLALPKVNVAHVGPQPLRVRVLLVLDQHGERTQGFLVHAVHFVLAEGGGESGRGFKHHE